MIEARRPLAPGLVERLVHRLFHARQDGISRVVARIEIGLGQQVAFLDVDRDVAAQRLGLAQELQHLRSGGALGDGEAPLHHLARLQHVDRARHRDVRRHLVLARLDRLGVGIDHQRDAEQQGVGDHPLLLQHLRHGRGSGTARNHHVVVLLQRPLRHQHAMADKQPTGEDGDEQNDEEQDPAEEAEHASASVNQTGPTIRQALVPPKPNELLSAWRTLRCLACLGTRSMSQPASGSSRLSVGGTICSIIDLIE